MHFGYWIRNPRRIWSRLRYWWWEKRNPDKPWLTPGAVEFLETALTREMSGLEFGSGRSTAWYAGKLGRLVSVEHEPVWHSRVKRELARLNCTNVDYRRFHSIIPCRAGTGDIRPCSSRTWRSRPNCRMNRSISWWSMVITAPTASPLSWRS